VLLYDPYQALIIPQIALFANRTCFNVNILYNQGMAMEEVKTPPHPPIFYWRWLVVLLVAGILAVWMSFTPEGVLGKADAVGYAVCHRIDLRSFAIGGRQLPLCARCTGQYLGALTGLAFQAIIAPRRAGSPPKRVIAFLALFAALYGMDGINSYFHLPPLLAAFPNMPLLYEPNNVLRLMTGTGMGLVISAALYPAFTSTLYRQYDRSSALPGLKALSGMGISALVVSGLVLTHVDWVLYPLALISSAGVLVLLATIYTIVILMALRRDNHYERLSQAIFPILAALSIAILQIAIMDVGRYLLTGTWGEFPMG
jgi:uncharacterized membrane protein